jgi:hypothetical protein
MAILDAISQCRQQGQPMPSDLAGLGLSDDMLTDGWMHPMRLVDANENSEDFGVLSAGPDGRFDTDDDIYMSPGSIR